MAAKWKDSSSWSRDDSAEKRKTPNSWTLEKERGGASIIVHQYLSCPGWFVTCRELKISAHDLDEKNIDKAKEKAEAYILDVAQKQLSAVEDLVHESRAEAALLPIVKRNVKLVKGSEIFVSLFTGGYEKDPVAVVQFGLAVLMDKPIIIVCPKGTVIPTHVYKIARVVRFFDPHAEEGPESIKDVTAAAVKGVLGELESSGGVPN